MACAEAYGRKTRVHVDPGVVVIRDAEVAGVLVTVVIGVSNEGTLSTVSASQLSDGARRFLGFKPTFQWSWN